MSATRMCPTCKTAFSDPACASPEHKRIEREIELGWLTPKAQGRGQYSSSRSSRKAAAIARQQNRDQEAYVDRTGQRRCPECGQWKPTAYFWNRKRRVLAKSCGKCRLETRTQRRIKGRGAKHHASAEVDNYWKAQAEAHP